MTKIDFGKGIVKQGIVNCITSVVDSVARPREFLIATLLVSKTTLPQVVRKHYIPFFLLATKQETDDILTVVNISNNHLR
jgi:hypothetical protein